jgi:hypothetical protein
MSKLLPPAKYGEDFRVFRDSQMLSYLSVCNKLLTDRGSELSERWYGSIQVQTCLYNVHETWIRSQNLKRVTDSTLYMKK